MAHSITTLARPGAVPPGRPYLIHGLLLAQLIVLPAMFWRLSMDVFEWPRAGWLELSGLGLLMLAIVQAGTWWRKGWQSFQTAARDLCLDPLTLVVLCGLFSAFLSTMTSVSPRTSFQGALESHGGFLVLAALGLTFLATRVGCRSVTDARSLLLAVVLSLPIPCLFGWFQVAGLDPFRWDWTSPFGGWTRPGSTLGHPINLGGYLVMVLPLVVWLIGLTVGRREWGRTASLAALGLGGGVLLIATLSRGAWVAGLAAALGLVLCRMRWRNVLLLIAGAILSLGFAWLVGGSRFIGPLADRMEKLGEFATRLETWSAAWRMFLDRPLTGWGLDTFHMVYGRYRSSAHDALEWSITPARAHNDPLHILATQGILGGLAYAALVVVLIRSWWRAWRNLPRERPLLAALGASLVGYFVQNLSGFTVTPTGVLMAVLCGILSRLRETPEQAPVADREESSSPGWLLGGCLAAWLILLANLGVEGLLTRPLGLLLLAAGGLACGGLLAMLAGLFPRRSTVPPIQSVPARLVPIPVLLRLGQAGLILGLAFVAVQQVLLPLAASWCCRIGESAQAHPATALVWHERAVELAPRHEVFWTQMANPLRRLGDEATRAGVRRRWRLREREALEQACALVPIRPDNRLNLARCLEIQAREGLVRPEDVLALFDSALADDPRSTSYLADAARAAVSLGFRERAREYVERGLALYPTLGPLHGERGALALLEGKHEVAERHFHHALEQGEWPGITERQGRVQGLRCLNELSRGRLTRVLQLANEVLSQSPDEVPIQWMRACALERLGRTSQAADEYRAILARHPDHEPTRSRLMRIHLLTQRMKRHGPTRVLTPAGP